MDRGVAGEICRTGRPLVANDYVRSAYRFRGVDEQMQFETRSMMGVPMRRTGRILGVFCLVNKEGGRFDDGDRDLLQAVADVVSLAVEHTRTRDNLHKAMARIEALDQAREAAIVHLSHELKTPLAVLDASLKLLERSPADTAEIDRHSAHDRARRSLERLLDMAYAVEDILRGSDRVTFDAMTQLPRPPDPEPPDAGVDERFFQQVNIEFLVHELKDPLSVIETNIRMLAQADGRMPEERRTRFMERIVRGTGKVRALLEALLEVGRAEAVCFNCRPFNPFDTVGEVLIEVVESHAPEIYEQIKALASPGRQLAALASRGIRIESQPGVESARMVQDETKVRQIVANLVKNALSYRRTSVLLNVTLHRSNFILAVRDDGPGIAEEHVEKIFERYRQVSPWPGVARHGHGLGLAVSRILARSMDGDIEVASQLGQGALFRLTLPLVFDGSE
jgi:signal transduction histidine kinase